MLELRSVGACWAGLRKTEETVAQGSPKLAARPAFERLFYVDERRGIRRVHYNDLIGPPAARNQR
jgi:hypothetical protein